MDKDCLKRKNALYLGYCRGYIPHFDGPAIRAITFCLGDGLPKVVLDRLAREQLDTPPENKDSERRRRIEAHLDRGMGACVLRDPRVAEIDERAFLGVHFKSFELHAWVIMPNHVHLVAGFSETVEWEVEIGRIKGVTVREIYQLLGVRGLLWQRESYDRFIRDESHFLAAISFVHSIPVKAGLSPNARSYRLNSARRLMRMSREGRFELVPFKRYGETIAQPHKVFAAAPAKASAPGIRAAAALPKDPAE